MLPNPDKSDDADPVLILINPQSDYYDISSLNKVPSKSGAKSFSFLHCNIRSLSKNIGLLEDMPAKSLGVLGSVNPGLYREL